MRTFNGAANCGAIRLWTLWLTLLALMIPAIASSAAGQAQTKRNTPKRTVIAPVLNVRIDNSKIGYKTWSGVWRRQGKSRLYLATPNKSADNQFRVRLVRVGRGKVTFVTVGGRRQIFTGTVNPDTNEIQGTFSDVKTRVSGMGWSAKPGS